MSIQTDIADAIAQCKNEIGVGNTTRYARREVGDCVVAVQMADRWNSRRNSIRVHVWRGGKLLRKAEWMSN
jgi:hypothetical protein